MQNEKWLFARKGGFLGFGLHFPGPIRNKGKALPFETYSVLRNALL
jgi:hypothetical protein